MLFSQLKVMLETFYDKLPDLLIADDDQGGHDDAVEAYDGQAGAMRSKILDSLELHEEDHGGCGHDAAKEDVPGHLDGLLLARPIGSDDHSPRA